MVNNASDSWDNVRSSVKSLGLDSVDSIRGDLGGRVDSGQETFDGDKLVVNTVEGEETVTASSVFTSVKEVVDAVDASAPLEDKTGVCWEGTRSDSGELAADGGDG